MSNIVMVDLKTQYHNMKNEVDKAVLDCLESSAFIKGPPVREFETNFAEYQGCKHVISCGNGTDALQLALMALGLKPGDEVIVPAFTYIATAEVIALLGLTPVMIDVDTDTFNCGVEQIESAITERTRAIVPVHLYGQSVDMEPLLKLAQERNIPVIEDAAQATGTRYTFSDGTVKMAGSMATIGCTSFFPTKNLGCYGDGGAIMTDDDDLAQRLRMVANHGQNKKYYHAMVGVNSRLDSLQAAILGVKLNRLDGYLKARQEAAAVYNQAFAEIPQLQTPKKIAGSTHTYHQYTLKVAGGRRDELKNHLAERGVPSVVYYPLPLHHQKAFSQYDLRGNELRVSEELCGQVLSLPIHTELDESTLQTIIKAVVEFFE